MDPGWIVDARTCLALVRRSVSKAKRPRRAVYLRRHGSDAYFFFPAFGLVFAVGFFGAVFFMTDLQEMTRTENQH